MILLDSLPMIAHISSRRSAAVIGGNKRLESANGLFRATVLRRHNYFIESLTRIGAAMPSP